MENLKKQQKAQKTWQAYSVYRRKWNTDFLNRVQNEENTPGSLSAMKNARGMLNDALLSYKMNPLGAERSGYQSVEYQETNAVWKGIKRTPEAKRHKPQRAATFSLQQQAQFIERLDRKVPKDLIALVCWVLMVQCDMRADDVHNLRSCDLH